MWDTSQSRTYSGTPRNYLARDQYILFFEAVSQSAFHLEVLGRLYFW